MSTSSKTAEFRQSRWFKFVWIAPVAIIVVVAGVLFAKWLRETPALQSFLAAYPGESELPESAPSGLPVWLAWQHGLNAFFMLFIISSGLRVRTTARPAAFFTRNNSGLIRTKGQPTRISLDLWLHITVNTLWVINGIVFYVLLFTTGQWTRIVPTHWDVFPNALSALLQYASFDWPTENGWTNYNGLQLLSYFAVVFILAPLALITGLRMSPAWSRGLTQLDKIYPVEVARNMHFPIMVIFLAFIGIHVLLVLLTGALRNLNHMYAARDEASWLGLAVFLGSVVIMAGAFIAARPVVLRSIASLMGKVGR